MSDLDTFLALALFAAVHLLVACLVLVSLARRVLLQRALERAWRQRLTAWARGGSQEV